MAPRCNPAFAGRIVEAPARPFAEIREAFGDWPTVRLGYSTRQMKHFKYSVSGQVTNVG